MTDKILKDLDNLAATATGTGTRHIAAEAAKTLRALAAIKLRASGQEYRDAWRGIAAAMGYEPCAHKSVRPTSQCILDRVAKYRAEAAEEHVAPLRAELEAVKAERDALQVAVNDAMDLTRQTDSTMSALQQRLQALAKPLRPLVGKVYRHRSDPGSAYRVLAVHDDVHSQYEGDWYPTVEYDFDSAFTSRRFSRTTKEFLAKFVQAGEGREYLIRKGGFFYRPNAEGHTNNWKDAGLFTIHDAELYSHPNGPSGPRDGITFSHVSEWNKK